MLNRFYLPSLLEEQDANGGWGYRPGGQSSVEPTCWVLLALQDIEKSKGEESQLLDFPTIRLLDSLPAVGQAAAHWLRECQLPDGSWPPFAGPQHGCWVTALACLALYAYGGSSDQVARGLQWLSNTWPAEGSLWWRMGASFLRGRCVVQHDASLRGWGWTPGTSSWVEPTSYALLAFRHIPKEFHPRGAMRRRLLAERMLYDRMCPGGGWNSGNPLVYGAAGVPRVGPTVWALLALEDSRSRAANLQSLDWLERTYTQIHSPGSLALAYLCLELHDRPVPTLEPSLAALKADNQLLGHTLATAWATIALSGRPHWLGKETGKWKFETRNSKMETRNSRTEIRDSKIGIGHSKELGWQGEARDP